MASQDTTGPSAQSGYRCRLEWGQRGAAQAVRRGDILVIVDTLRFSTAAAAALQQGVHLYPCTEEDDVMEIAKRVGAQVGDRNERRWLSPQSYADLSPGARVAVSSPNGATCSRYAQRAPFLLVGALVNASATGKTVQRLIDTTDYPVTILACGERWLSPFEGESLRFALEDYLGAGAVLSRIEASRSPEAEVCMQAFLSMRDRLETTLMECGSGRELQLKGLAADVRLAATLDLFSAVPMMRDGHLEPAVADGDG